MVDEVHPVLDTGKSVRDLGEVASAEFFLLGEAEWAVVGGHDRQVVCSQTPPERGLMLAGTKWRRADELGPLELRARHVVLRQEQVLGTGLGEGVLPAVASFDYSSESRSRGQVDNVQRSPCHLGESDGPGGRLAFELRGPAEPVVNGVGLAPGECRLDYGVYGDAVLGVDHD